MDTLEGTVSHSQNTVQVSGGGNNSQVTTTYVAMFRLEQRQVQFNGRKPLSISDGDRTVVAGRGSKVIFYADAVRNLTTGVTAHSGIWGRVFFAVFVLIFGVVFTLIAGGMFGRYALGLYLVFIGVSVYLCVRAAQTFAALRQVEQSPV